jgi:hypothetical protein
MEKIRYLPILNAERACKRDKPVIVRVAKPENVRGGY